MNIITQVQAEIQAVARPLYDRLLLLDEEVGQRETELGELKKARTQLRNVVKGIDPSLVVAPATKRSKKNEPSEESVNAVREFLLLHSETVNLNGGFHASGLAARYPSQLPVSKATLNKALVALHEQGAIRLVSTGTGGAKYYKVEA